MSIGIVLSEAADVPLAHWASLLARARREGLVLLWTSARRRTADRESTKQQGTIPSELESICEALVSDHFYLLVDGENGADADQGEPTETDELPRLPLEIVSLRTAEKAVAIQNEVAGLDITLLILPRDAQLKSSSPEFAVHRHLLSHVPCEVMLLTPGQSDAGNCRSILSPVGEGPHSINGLRVAREIAQVTDAQLVALYVEPEVDEVAAQVGQRILARRVTRALGSADQSIEQRVVLANDALVGIQNVVDGTQDLMVLGMRHHGIVHRFFFQGLSERIVQANPGPTIAVVQAAMPLTSQVLRAVDQLFRSNVPQMPRERRVALVERIRSSSRWDFDFIALICLSTLIAAGGLIENSVAIVIGAMLVAPLMTPLLGTGLSLVQGNWVLFRSTMQTVVRGFLLAFALGYLVGTLIPNVTVTSEMNARGSPRFLDLLVALISGIAAAYATGRPNLLSALPGVAIAASLVPPIATAGLAARLGQYQLALGAALLFFTNIVAIVLGTAASFWAVGVRGSHQHGSFGRWALGRCLAVLLVTLLLAVSPMWLSDHIPQDLSGAIADVLQNSDARCGEIHRLSIDGKSGVELQLQGPKQLPPQVLRNVQSVVRKYMDDVEVVRINTRLSETFDN